VKRILYYFAVADEGILKTSSKSESSLLLFEGFLLIFLRVSVIVATVVSTMGLPQQPTVPIGTKIVSGLLIVLPLYYFIERNLIIAIRRRRETPWSTYLILLLPAKYCIICVFSLLHQRLYYGPIIVNPDASTNLWPTSVLFAFIFIEMIPLFIEFHLNLSQNSSSSPIDEDGKKSVRKGIKKSKKDEWLNNISKNETSLVLSEMLSNVAIRQNKPLYGKIVNISSRWSHVMHTKQTGLEDFAKITQQMNNINQALIEIIENL
jgi:hypothetical protein